MYTIKEFAEHMRVHINTVYRWIENGMPVIRYEKTIRIKLEDALEWMDKNK